MIGMAQGNDNMKVVKHKRAFSREAHRIKQISCVASPAV